MCFRLSLPGGAECVFCEDQSREKRIRPQEMRLPLIFIKPGNARMVSKSNLRQSAMARV